MAKHGLATSKSFRIDPGRVACGTEGNLRDLYRDLTVTGAPTSFPNQLHARAVSASKELGLWQAPPTLLLPDLPFDPPMSAPPVGESHHSHVFFPMCPPFVFSFLR